VRPPRPEHAATGRAAWAAAAALSLLASCTATWWSARFARPASGEALDLGAPFLKAHTADGGVYVLANWRVDPDRRLVSGEGVRYDAERRPRETGAFEIPFDRIAVAETNRPERVVRTGLVTVGVLAGASAIGTAACLANPKACFGSCPTFHLEGPGGQEVQAEGFSSSVAAYEATDVDAIEPARPLGAALDIEMRNEALETHLVRGVRLLAVPRPAAGRVFAGDGGFFPATTPLPPLSCAAETGDCGAALAAADGREWS
jgi:hypothetical protein